MPPTSRLSCSVVRALIAMLAALVLRPAPADAQATVPRVTFEYSALFDAPCYTAMGQHPDSVTIRAALARLPVWRAAWERDAPALLRAVLALTHAPFEFAETKAAVITCGAFPTMSLPLMINARRVWAGLDTARRGGAESSGAGGVDARESRQFVSLLIHEVLHRYVTDRVESLPGHTTPLLRKYAAEPRAVRAHLHVFALMEEAFGAVGWTAQAAAVLRPAGPTAEIAGMRGANDLDRARAIVAAEGPAALVRELARPP